MAMTKRRWALAIVTVAVFGCRDDARKSPAPKPAPAITGIIPTQVTPRGYRIGEITGDGFDPKAPVRVLFGTIVSPRAAVVTKNKVQVEIPPGKDGTEVEVRVEVAGYEPAVVPAKLKYVEGLEDPDEAPRGSDHE